MAIHLDVTQRTDIVGTASHIKGVVDGGKGRHGIGARYLHLTHDADGDACLSQCQVNLRTLIAWTDDLAQTTLSLTD